MATIDQRVAIITGASSGIGRAASRRLIEMGWCVAIAARGEEALSESLEELVALSGDPERAIARVCDMGSVEEIRSLIEHVAAHFGRVDGLINNAGFAARLPIERTDAQTIHRTYMVNAIGPSCAVHFAWPHLAQEGGGRVVNLSSMASVDPFSGFFAYAGSKAAINIMTRCCDEEGRARGVRAFAVAPGAVETPMLRGMFDQRAVPSAACLSPDQVAEVIVQCVSGARDEDGGKTILLSRDGGQMVEEVR